MAFVTFPSVGPYAPASLTADLNTNFGKTLEATVTGVADGEFLIYNGSSSTWINATAAEITINLSDMDDVSVSSLVDGEVLTWNASSSSWINSALPSVPVNIQDLNNVTVSGVADGEFLVWDGSSSSWINATAAEAGVPTTIAELTGDLADIDDVSLSTLADGEVLTWNSSSNSWINAAAAGGGGNVEIEGDGTSLTTAVSKINFVGFDVTEPVTDEIQVKSPYPAPPGNFIINGGMDIWQRGTSSTSVTTAEYLADRFNFAPVTMGTWTIEQSTDVPAGEGFGYSFKATVTTADASPAAADNVRIIYKFEGQFLQSVRKGTASAKELTLSFWVKSDTTGTYIADLVDDDNSRQVSQSYTIDVADTWEYKTVTFPADTTGAWNNDNAQSATLNFWLGSGTNFNSGTLNTSWASQVNANRAVGQTNLAAAINNYINITGVQLELGDTASEFEFKPYDEVLRKCQRYYWKMSAASSAAVASGYAKSTSSAEFTIHYPVPLRTASPTISENSMQVRETGGTGTAASLNTAFWGTVYAVFISMNADSGTPFVADAGCLLATSGTGYIDFDAEL